MSRTLGELSDLELMTIRKRVTYREMLRDNDIYILVQIAKEYIRRGYGVSGLWHLDTYTPGDFRPPDDDEE